MKSGRPKKSQEIDKLMLYQYDGYKNKLVKLNRKGYQQHRGHPERPIKKIPMEYQEPDIPIQRVTDDQHYHRVIQEKDTWVLEHGDIVKAIGYYLEPDAQGSYYAKIGTSKMKGRLLVTAGPGSCFVVGLGAQNKNKNPFKGELENGVKISLSHNAEVTEKEINEISAEIERKQNDQNKSLAVTGAVVGGLKEKTYSGIESKKDFKKIQSLFQKRKIPMTINDTCKVDFKKIHKYDPLGLVIDPEDNSVRFIRNVYGRPPNVQSWGTQELQDGQQSLEQTSLRGPQFCAVPGGPEMFPLPGEMGTPSSQSGYWSPAPPQHPSYMMSPPQAAPEPPPALTPYFEWASPASELGGEPPPTEQVPLGRPRTPELQGAMDAGSAEPYASPQSSRHRYSRHK